MGGANCTGASLELVDARFLSNTQYRDGRIWAVHHAWLPASGTPDRTAAFWYQLDPAAMPDPIVQSGVIDGGAGVHHIYPSIAANCAEDVCIGFTRGSPTICPEAAFTTRLVGDAPGTTRAIQVIKAGEGPNIHTHGGGSNFWGYYSATVVEPMDDRTFWTIQEYVGPEYFSPFGGGRRWGTWWGQIAQDCNLNGMPDSCDEAMNDCNQNGVSDACECCRADANGDGRRNAADISAFIAALLTPPDCAGPGFFAFCRADANADGAVDLADVAPFVQRLLTGITCP